ncbi:MAG: CDP-archaeol synthase [Desulfobacterium sp.]|nr:CDP-archaeol synthase [Desulfobacterium sp.]
MIIYAKMIVLLLFINAIPAIMMPFFSKARPFGMPMDFNLRFLDGRAWLGKHKTVGGFGFGILAGGTMGYCLGFPLALGFGSGFLAMAGDSVSSFIKRRFSFNEGTEVRILDQIFQGGFPLVLFHSTHDFPPHASGAMLIIFIVAGIFASRLHRRFFFPSQQQVSTVIRSKSGFKEWRACHIALSPMARLLNFENVIYYRLFMQTCFKLSGLYNRGVNNALDVRVNALGFSFKRLPKAFDQYKILFMSDLHLDGLDGLTERLIEIVKNQPVDLCLLGGDYRMEMYGQFQQANEKLGELVQHIHARDGVFGILGNHDCIEIAPDLEDSNICMLINDAMVLERDGRHLAVCGVDDPHYYQCHDLDKALREVPETAFKILLSHSPEIINSLDHHDIDLCLSGHTHGGQICLPLIGPVFTHCPVPRRFVSGRWQHNNTCGYTSCGAGSSGIPVRYNCRPEVLVITLSRSP